MSIIANQPSRFVDQLNDQEQRALLEWIDANLSAWVGGHRRQLNSYYLKHLAENDLGFYITNGALKGAMDAAGWEPNDRSSVNWTYRARLTRQEGGS